MDSATVFRSAKKSMTSAMAALLTTGLVVLGVTAPAQAAVSPLCDVSRMFDTSYEWIDTIELNNVTLEPDFSNGDYANVFAAGAAPVALTAGHTYTLTTQVTGDNSDGDWTENLAAWTDFNGDLKLPVSERLMNESSMTVNWTPTQGSELVHTYSKSFKLPANAVNGDQWMRVMNYDNDDIMDSCATGLESGRPGGVADFKVKITGGVDASTSNKSSFKVYFAPGSAKLSKKAKAKIRKEYKAIKSEVAGADQVKVSVKGWAQPTSVGPDSKNLSKKRAKAVVKYLQKLGLKATYKAKAGGDAKSHSKKSRRATVTISWS